MEVLFTCPHCGCTIETDSELSGARAECPSCSEVVLVPAPGVKKGVEFGGFRIERKLGAGGMGEVFLATQLAMDRPVALKILPPALTNDELMVKRFLHEVRMAAKMEHPNIVTAFDAGEADDFHYMAMSYVEGDDLKAILKEQGTLEEGDALTIVERVADALDYAWTKFEMLHRDLKPANIMITTDGEVRLMDMGIAKSVSEDSNLTMKGMLVGTPFYVSPEQAMSRSDIDCRADIYSLGATLYQMVTGKKPHEASTAMAVVAKHISEDVESPKTLNPEISDGCDRLILKMMSRNREDRYADWKELKNALAVLLSRPVHEYVPEDHGTLVMSTAAGATMPIEAPRKKESNPLVIVGAIAALLAIIVISGAAYVLTRSADIEDEMLAEKESTAGAHVDPARERQVAAPEPRPVDEIHTPIRPEEPPQPSRPDREKQDRDDLIQMLKLAKAYAEDHPEDERGIASKYGLIRKHASDLDQVRFVMQADEELRKIEEDREARKEEEARKAAEHQPVPNRPHVDPPEEFQNDQRNMRVKQEPADWRRPMDRRPDMRSMPSNDKRNTEWKDEWRKNDLREPGRMQPGRCEPGRYEPGRDEPGRDEPGRDEPGDRTATTKPPVMTKTVPPVYIAKSRSELMKKMVGATEKLADKFQYLPALQLVEGYDGEFADTTRRDREELGKKLRKKYEAIEPLRRKVRECMAMIYENRHEDATRFLQEQMEHDREIRRSGTTGRNAMKVLEALIESRQRPGRKPRGLRSSAKLIVGAFEMATRGRHKDAAKMLVKVESDIVAEIMLGEIRQEMLSGTWTSDRDQAQGLEVELQVHNDQINARFGNKHIEGAGWILGDWIYVRSRDKTHCWRVGWEGHDIKLGVAGIGSIKLSRGDNMPGGFDPRDNRMDRRMDERGPMMRRNFRNP